MSRALPDFEIAELGGRQEASAKGFAGVTIGGVSAEKQTSKRR
jgi:hypothetical protein